jgi:hypothetical protein
LLSLSTLVGHRNQTEDSIACSSRHKTTDKKKQKKEKSLEEVKTKMMIVQIVQVIWQKHTEQSTKLAIASQQAPLLKQDRSSMHATQAP